MLSRRGRVALHFHPDRDVAGQPVLERILARGAYVSQFVTGTGNGGLTARDRGSRWQWEHRIFSGAYDLQPAEARPVYGALALDDDPYGPAPRFGSAYLLLHGNVTGRSTYAYPDSVFEPAAVGVGEPSAWAELLRADPQPDPLDRYVEAHVHGGVAVPGDVAALVLDPSFAGASWTDAAAAAGVAAAWHPGYRLTVETLAEHAEYRGPDVVGLATDLASDGVLTPAVLGAARGRPEIDAQLLKQVWHCVARFGRQEARDG